MTIGDTNVCLSVCLLAGVRFHYYSLLPFAATSATANVLPQMSLILLHQPKLDDGVVAAFVFFVVLLCGCVSLKM